MVDAAAVLVLLLIAATAGYRVGRATRPYVPPPEPRLSVPPAVQVRSRGRLFDWERDA